MVFLQKQLALAASTFLVISTTYAFLPPIKHTPLVPTTQISKQIMTPAAPSPPYKTHKLNSSTSKETEKELTSETIAEMIEVSFINSCLQLASGYVDVLKLFIVAVKAGYEAKLTLNELETLVEECPVNTANRELMKEEKDLRREWMLVVYEMLDGLMGHADDGGNNRDNSEPRVSQVVSSILAVRQQLQLEEEASGGKQDAEAALANLSVSDVFARSESLSKMRETCEKNPMEKAFLMNDVSVGILTCKVLREEKVCGEGSSGNAAEPPRPPIPGTS